MRGWLLFVCAFALSASAPAEPIRLALEAGGTPGTRVFADTPIEKGSLLDGALAFDLSVTVPEPIDRYLCYVRSGDGWYRTKFEPTSDDVEANRTYSVVLSTADILEVEGSPAGWRNADCVRLAAYRATSAPSVVTVSNLHVERSAKEVLFVRNAQQKDADATFVDRMRDSFSALGIGSMSLDQDDLSVAGLDGVRLLVFAHVPSLPDACLKAVEEYVARGGKVFAAYLTPHRLAKLLGVEGVGTVRSGENGQPRLKGFARGPDALVGQPAFAPQASWMCRRVKPLPGARVAACWQTDDDRVTDLPGVVVSSNGVYVSHVWLGESEGASLELFASVVETALPGTRTRLASLRQRQEARRKDTEARLAALPGKAGERRFAWCHSAWGLDAQTDWDASCRFLKENGFTDLLANLAWGGCAFYPSKVLPRSEKGPRGDALEACKAACRKHGIGFHVWKVCWNQGTASPKAFTDALVAEGRCCVDRKGERMPRWNCPSDPKNRQLEIDAMAELALEKGVDGIHFDYIRYHDRSVCFCANCRARFERRIGRTVSRWPQDAVDGGCLADEWNRFRCDNITAVVRGVHERVKAVRPEVEISAATFRDPEVTPTTVAQDWVPWCRAGWLDFVCPMDYISRPGRFASCIRSQKAALEGTKTALYPGLAIDCSAYRRIGAEVPALEIMAVREAGLGGFALFHLAPYAREILPELRKGPLKPVREQKGVAAK